MTTRIKVTNDGPRKVRVVAVEARNDGAPILTPMHILNPGETYEVHVWSSRGYVVEEEV